MLARAVGSGGAKRRRRPTVKRSEGYICEYFYRKLKEFFFEIMRNFFKLQRLHRMHLKCRRGQSGVAERSDADGRLQRALSAALQIVFAENMKNVAKNQIIMIYNIIICVQLDSLMNERSFRKGSANR